MGGSLAAAHPSVLSCRRSPHSSSSTSLSLPVGGLSQSQPQLVPANPYHHRSLLCLTELFLAISDHWSTTAASQSSSSSRFFASLVTAAHHSFQGRPMGHYQMGQICSM